jgi:GlpG protein
MNIIWHAVVSFSLEKNLLSFLSQLKQRGITSRVTEEEGRQQLWIREKHRIAEVVQLSSQWSSGDLNLGSEPQSSNRSEGQSRRNLLIVNLLQFFPVSMLTISLGVLGTLLVHLDTERFTYVQLFLFQPLVNESFLPVPVIAESGQYWRLLTPIFLHFSIFHILFNGTILWVMGTRIERVQGSFHYLLLIIAVGIISNIAQYLSETNTIFGGLSGVVYGVIGYIAVYQTFISHPLLQFNRSIIVFFIIWLLLGFTGIIDFFIAGKIANMSHLVGLVAGAGIGYVLVLKGKYRHSPQV